VVTLCSLCFVAHALLPDKYRPRVSQSSFDLWICWAEIHGSALAGAAGADDEERHGQSEQPDGAERVGHQRHHGAAVGKRQPLMS